jgi:hypothetical protein
MNRSARKRIFNRQSCKNFQNKLAKNDFKISTKNIFSLKTNLEIL